MASELTFNLSVEYVDSFGVTMQATPAIEDVLVTVATKKSMVTVQSVGTSEEALLLGDITSRGTCVLVNLDPTNYIEVKVATGGAIFAKLFPKGSTAGVNFCVVHLGSGAQSPFVIANTASCDMAIFLASL